MGSNQLSPRATSRMLTSRTKRIPGFPCRVEGWLNICGESRTITTFIRQTKTQMVVTDTGQHLVID